MPTKSSHKRACESFNGSNTSLKSINPPWCSGKLTERRKLSPNWEIQSSYPMRENIWEYLHDDGENLKWRSKRLNRKTNKPEKYLGTKIKLLLLLFCLIGVIGGLWKLYPTESSKIMQKTTFLTAELLKIIDWRKITASEECRHNVKGLMRELSRKERILRNTLRFKSMVSTRQANDGPFKASTLIKDLVAYGGWGTQELHSRSVSLWGLWPLWRTAPSPNTVLSQRGPQPGDCWAFSGSTGTLHIVLPNPRPLHGIMVEHIKPDTAKSAPQSFELVGVLYDTTKLGLLKGLYIQNKEPKQYYYINCNDVIKEVIFKVLSNQGNKDYTCIYRINLYGHNLNNGITLQQSITKIT